MRRHSIFWLSVLCTLLMGCNLMSGLPTDEDGGGENPEPEPAEYEAEDYWQALADEVEGGTFRNTDQVVLTAERLERRGFVDDLSRLETVRQKREELDSATTEKVESVLRGGSE